MNSLRSPPAALSGTMMDIDLTVGSILKHANRFHGDRQIATRSSSSGIHRYTYRDLYRRSERLCLVLASLGAVAGDRIGTLAWNSYRHLEVYFAAPAMGAIAHTINPRLFPEQIEYIINHAGDRLLLVDPGFVPLVEKIRPKLRSVERIIVLDDSAPQGYLSYESLLSSARGNFAWPEVSEQSGATLCYTSGTTGNPKGVLYSHRSAVLHAMATSGADWFAIRKRDAVMPVVPMYHVNAWSLPYSAAMNGAKLVLPGAALDSKSLLELISLESVTLAAGVPTIFADLLNHVGESARGIGKLERVIVGGTAPTPSLVKTLEEKHSVTVLHGWGMTETSSCAVLNAEDERSEGWDPEDRRAFLTGHMRPLYPVDVRIADASGADAPWDGKTVGQLMVRSPTVTEKYFGLGEQLADATSGGWLTTGDMATIDAHGYVEIVDRAKDLIKSGGEWISSIALENLAATYPDILEAAVVAIPHPRWDERPLLVYVARPGSKPDVEAILAHFDGKVAKWWIPDDAVSVEALPKQATGKVWKARLREQFADFKARGRSASRMEG